MEETELLTFSSLSGPDLHRFRQSLDLDKMVNKYMPVLPNFTKRSMAETGAKNAYVCVCTPPRFILLFYEF